jgi:peptide-methionine (S)-S-oxide reductase
MQNTTIWTKLGILLAFLMLASCSKSLEANDKTTNKNKNKNPEIKKEKKAEKMNDRSEYKIATFGAGCFWCVEAVFESLDGVHKVESGYTGGKTKKPTYKEICTGLTGHAEVCRLTYDPKVITFPELLEVFWKTHNPTTLNRQGNDVGTQYRSAIFYHDEEQKNQATEYKEKLNKAKAWSKPIVTEITAATIFYPAEDYHQDYYTNNPNQSYCVYVIQPKMEKFKEAFRSKLKK